MATTQDLHRATSPVSKNITAFVASIDEPVGLLGWSGGGPLVLDAAEQIDTVTAVAVWEGGTDLSVAPPEVADDFARLGAAVEQAAIAAAGGRPADAVRAFLIGICNDEELAVIEDTTFCEAWSVGIPELLSFFQHMAAGERLEALTPEALARVSAPTLFLTGSSTLLDRAFPTAAALLASSVPRGRMRHVEGLGHFAPVVAPERLTHELTGFFEEVRQPVGTP